MRSVCRRALSLLLSCLFLAAGSAHAGHGKEFTRTITKDFNVSAESEINLSNKYGKITVVPWEQNKVKIEVRIVVQARNAEEAGQVFDRINIAFSGTGTYVSAATEIESKDENWWKWLKSWGMSSDDFKIYYDVRMPRKASLTTTARYCDVTAGAFLGRARMDVKYGNLRLDRVENDVEIALAYGNGSTGPLAGNLDLSLRYGKLNTESARNAVLNTRYSEVRIEKAEDLRSDSRYDDFSFGELKSCIIDAGYSDYDIDKVGSLRVDAKYADVKVDVLTGQLDAVIDYGEVEVDRVMAGFDHINFRGRYADLDLGMASGAGYSLDAESSYADLSYPGSLNVSYDVKRGSSHTVRGKLGSGAGKVEARLSYGGLRIQ